MAKLDAGGDAAKEAADAYAAYEARVGELEQELKTGTEAAAEIYGSYEARVGELEQETQVGKDQAAATYTTYESRIAELERQNKALAERLAAKEQQLAAVQQGAATAVSPTVNMEMRLQLEAMRSTLDQMLKKLERDSGQGSN